MKWHKYWSFHIISAYRKLERILLIKLYNIHMQERITSQMGLILAILIQTIMTARSWANIALLRAISYCANVRYHIAERHEEKNNNNTKWANACLSPTSQRGIESPVFRVSCLPYIYLYIYYIYLNIYLVIECYS